MNPSSVVAETIAVRRGAGAGGGAKSQKLFTQKLLDPKATPLATLTPRPNPNHRKATQLSCSADSCSQCALCCFHDAPMCHMLLWELKAGIGSASIAVVHPKDGTRPKSYSTGRLTQKLLHWQPDPKATHIGERLSEAPSHPQPDSATPSDSMMVCLLTLFKLQRSRCSSADTAGTRHRKATPLAG